MTVMAAEPRPKSWLILTCMPLIRRAYEADCGISTIKPEMRVGMSREHGRERETERGMCWGGARKLYQRVLCDMHVAVSRDQCNARGGRSPMCTCGAPGGASV